MPDSNFQQTNTGADVLSSYANATKFSPISETKKTQVLKDYGISAGWAKGKTDTAISQEAAAKVLAKFKRDQAKANQPKLSDADIQKTLNARGLPGTKPPDYARVDAKALEAWIQRTLKISQVTPTLQKQLLTQAGFPNARPPAYALVSTYALMAWIERARRYAATR